MEKEFLPLIENPRPFVSRALLSRKNRKVIKAEQLRGEGADSLVQVFSPGDLSDREPEVVVREVNGAISEIEFICPCGCRAMVQLETAPPEAAPTETLSAPAEEALLAP